MKRIIREILKEEVDNRISREDYLNKILGYLVEDTIIDFKENEILFPSLPSSSLLLSSLFLFPSSPFSEYCRDNYGLTENEIDYVWKEYRNIINEKMENSNSINESMGRKSDYLNNIVGYIVDDTIIDFDVNQMRFPFYSQLYPLLVPRLSPTTSFSEYCRDNYGLTDEEIDYVWKEYRIIINEKISELT